MQPSMPNTPGPDAPPTTAIGHEPHWFNIRGVVMAGVALAVLGAIALLVASGVMSALEPSEHRLDKMLTDRRVLPQDIGRIRPPVLQDSNADDLIALRKKETAMLKATEWVDRGKGVVRIPIERAMELLVQEKGR
jgi:hypothetical protein